MELHCSLVSCLVSSCPRDCAIGSPALTQSALAKFSALSSAGLISRCGRRSKLVEGTRSFLSTLRRQQGVVVAGLLPVDPWSPTVDSQSLASQLFAVSLLPYLGFLYHITKSKTAPRLTLFGFYFLLVFVGATIPAGIYAKVHYGTSLSNVDWLHGGAEFFLTLTNLFIVLGLRQALRASQEEDEKAEVEEKDTVGSTK